MKYISFFFSKQDLGAKDLQREKVFLVCQIIRLGKLDDLQMSLFKVWREQKGEYVLSFVESIELIKVANLSTTSPFVPIILQKTLFRVVDVIYLYPRHK